MSNNRNYTGFTPGPKKFDNTGGGVTPEQEALINEIPDIKSDITGIETALEKIDEFEPSNSGNSGQVLTKGKDGYGWGDLPSVDEFEPSNSGTTGQVLTKGKDGYGWQDPQGGGNEFEPENTGTLGDVLTKTATGYAWQTPSEYGPVQQSLTMNDTLRETTNLTQGTLNNESESLSDSLSITTSVEVVE